MTVYINWWRPGGTAWFTVLHQPAWHGAPTEVAAELIRCGALRSLCDSRGRTAHDVRYQRDFAVAIPKVLPHSSTSRRRCASGA